MRSALGPARSRLPEKLLARGLAFHVGDSGRRGCLEALGVAVDDDILRTGRTQVSHNWRPTRPKPQTR